MKIYIGQTRSAKLVSKLARFGWGEMTVRGELPPRRLPWAFDNGAFRDWNQEAPQPFDEDAFKRDIDTIAFMDTRPDFVVVPDIVAGGLKSFEFSCSWLERLDGIAPLYLAVQDGIGPRHVGDILTEFDGVFVGGTLEWKKRTGEEWVAFAHQRKKPCHIGRVGSGKRVRWARQIGADSIDSCLPLFSVGNLEAFRSQVQTPQRQLFEALQIKVIP